MRQESSPLCGRDQLSYRSSYFPVKEVVDGDMCEMFTSLPHDKQRMIAEELDRWVLLVDRPSPCMLFALCLQYSCESLSRRQC